MITNIILNDIFEHQYLAVILTDIILNVIILSDDMTFSIMTFSITTFSIIRLNITTFSIIIPKSQHSALHFTHYDFCFLY